MKTLDTNEITLEVLFTDHNNTFSIPYYQRPYSWEEEQCAELWHDLINYIFPNHRATDFDSSGKPYFLGNMVAYSDQDSIVKLVDGQQRTISLMLLMRALYNELHDTENGRQLGRCIWRYTEKFELVFSEPRIETNAILDKAKNQVRQILVSGNTRKGDKDLYTKNFRFFQCLIEEFKNRMPDNLEIFAGRLLRNVMVVRMLAVDEDQALESFLTLNTRGKPLRVADIFQAKLCEIERSHGDEAITIFQRNWEKLDERCQKLFAPGKPLSPLEYIFSLYAETQKASYSWKNLRKFYSNNDYALLKSEQTFSNIEKILCFFETLHASGEQLHVPKNILQKAHILFHINKDAAFHLLAQYCLNNNKGNASLFDEKLETFLERCIANFIRAVCAGDSYGFANKTENAHSLAFAMMSGDIPARSKINLETLKFNLAHFYNVKAHERGQSVIVKWWTFSNESQPRIPFRTKLNIEHLCAKAIVAQRDFNNPYNVELPGNLFLLEATLNKKASARSFADKRKYLAESKNKELKQLAMTIDDFSEAEILKRNKKITEAIIALLDKNGFLLK